MLKLLTQHIFTRGCFLSASAMGVMSSKASCSSSSLPPLPPITAAPPAVPAPDSQQKASGSEVTAEDVLSNPGTYEEIGRKLKEQLYPQVFDGAKIIIQKGLSRYFQTTHTITLGSDVQPSQWQFGATYVGSKVVGENEYRPVMTGDMSTSGNFTAMILHQFGSSWKLKFNAQTQKSRWAAYQGTLDYTGKDFTASATLANPNVLSGSGVLALQYLQSMTERLALGCELVYQRAGSELQDASLSVGGYYRAKTWEATARLGVHSWAIGYQQQFKDNLMLMADLEGSLMQGDSIAGIGYRLELDGMTMRGKLDTHGIVSAVLEKRLDPMPATLMVSGQMNHWTDESRFGIAITVG